MTFMNTLAPTGATFSARACPPPMQRQDDARQAEIKAAPPGIAASDHHGQPTVGVDLLKLKDSYEGGELPDVTGEYLPGL